MAGARGRCSFAAAPAALLGLGRSVSAFDVTRFEEFHEFGVFEGLEGDLSGFAGAEKQLFPAGERDADGFAGLVGDVHGRCRPIRIGVKSGFFDRDVNDLGATTDFCTCVTVLRWENSMKRTWVSLIIQFFLVGT